MKKIMLVTLFALVTLLSVIVLWTLLNIEMEKNPILKENLKERKIVPIYKEYFLGELALSPRPWFGNENAPVTIISVIDFSDSESLNYIESDMQDLLGLLVQEGTAKVTVKYSLNLEEYEEKKDRFIYAASGLCIQKSGLEVLLRHRELAKTSSEEVPKLLESYGINAEEQQECALDPLLREDALQTDNQKMISPSTHIGLAQSEYTALYGRLDSDEFYQVVREKQVQIGI